MLIRQLDNWVRRAVDATRVGTVERSAIQEDYQGPERRKAQDRRHGLDRRKEFRFGVEASDRRNDVDRRAVSQQVKAIN